MGLKEIFLMELIKFIFSSFWIYIGLLAILCVISRTLITLFRILFLKNDGTSNYYVNKIIKLQNKFHEVNADKTFEFDRDSALDGIDAFCLELFREIDDKGEEDNE